MGPRGLDCHTGHLFKRIHPERTAGGGQDDPFDRGAILSGQHLKNRIVLAVDRQQGATGQIHRIHEQVAATHEAFLVGKRNRAAILGRSKCRLKTCHADNGRHGHVSGNCGSFDQGLASGGGFNAGSRQGILQGAIVPFIRRYRDFRPEFDCLFRQKVCVRSACQRDDLERIPAKMAQDIKRVDADGAGCAQDRYAAG